MKRINVALLVVLMALCGGCDGFVDGITGGDDGNGGGDDTGPGGSGDRTLLFYYGPMKPMPAETILHSIEAITGHSFGSWDYTTPEPSSQAFVDSGNAGGQFYAHCRLLGGCMEHRIPLGRTSFVGTAYVLQLEKAVAEACYDREAYGMFPGRKAPDTVVQPIDVIAHQYLAIYGAEPSVRDLELSISYFSGHLSQPEFDDVSPLESAGRGHCRALLTTNRFLFY